MFRTLIGARVVKMGDNDMATKTKAGGKDSLTTKGTQASQHLQTSKPKPAAAKPKPPKK